MVLTVPFVLSPVIGLYCHRRWRIEACLHPVGPTCLRKLDAGVEASGPHDFAVRFTAVRLRALRSLTGLTPALRSPRTRGRCRVHRIPFPTSVTIAIRPSEGRDGGGYRSDLGQAKTKIFLQRGLDTQVTDLPVGHNQLDPVQTNSNFPQAAACCRAASPAVHRGYGPRINRL